MRFLSAVIALWLSLPTVSSRNVIYVDCCSGDATRLLQNAIDSCAGFDDEEKVTIRLTGDTYNLSRAKSSQRVYHISNTASEKENPNPTKHVGLLFRKLKNVTFDGGGARLITHGEMTPIVIDSCESITMTNFTLNAADPSVAEVTVTAVGNSSVVYEVIEPSQFDVTDGHFNFKGEGWVMADGGRLTRLPELAQVFLPQKNVTYRVESPLKSYRESRRISDRAFEMVYDNRPDVKVGEIYQLRHGIRNEVAGFVNRSRNVSFRDIEFNFMGNFGLVGQYSENLTFDNLRCRPDLKSHRTNAGYADFVHISGCKGKIRILNSHFEGAQDDAINIHGTHLKVVDYDGDRTVTVRFMHGQSYGFKPFYPGDTIEFVNRNTLLPLSQTSVAEVTEVDAYNFRLKLEHPLPALPEGFRVENIAVENVTWTPEVEISNNYFARIPTRGILITTRRKSVIENNVFYRIPMPAILISDDARSWYESGRVKDLTIIRNTFIECSAPVISICPEVSGNEGPVHRNIAIINNRFTGIKGNPVSVRGAENVVINL